MTKERKTKESFRVILFSRKGCENFSGIQEQKKYRISIWIRTFFGAVALRCRLFNCRNFNQKATREFFSEYHLSGIFSSLGSVPVTPTNITTAALKINFFCANHEIRLKCAQSHLV